MFPAQDKKEQLIGMGRITKCGHRSETRIYLGRFSGYYLLRNRGFVRTDQSIFIKSGILHGVVIVRGCSWGKLWILSEVQVPDAVGKGGRGKAGVKPEAAAKSSPCHSRKAPSA